jgi:catechol 2,3-dioxygenase-like lactoylglutathione lyase family enzyme
MYDHIGLNTKNLAKSVRFYSAVLESLGYKLGSSDDSGASFVSESGSALYLAPASAAPSSGVHIAFNAPDRASVTRFHRNGLEAGGRDNGAPGLRADYSPTYYAAFLFDPDGNNVEAVCMSSDQ